MRRCGWINEEIPFYLRYHDEEWGVPVHDDRKLFEMLCLEGAQAGLSWETILKKRNHYKECFANFDAKKIAKFSDEKLEKLLTYPGLVRNRLKIFSVRSNAEAFIKVKNEFGSFDSFIWAFVEGHPIVNKWKSLKDIPPKTDVSDKMSKELKKRGFKFVGSTICYSFMQAVGMVNDHLVTCYRHKDCKKLSVTT